MKTTVSKIKINNVIFMRVDKGDKYYNVSHRDVYNHFVLVGYTFAEAEKLATEIMEMAYSQNVNLELFIMLANENDEDDWKSDDDDDYDFVELLKLIM